MTQAQSGGEPSVISALPKPLAVADMLPPFSAKDENGDKIFQRRHLERMAEQEPNIKRVALVYFATWCRPCAEGAARLKKAREILKKNGVIAVFVNVGETDVTSIKKWIRSYGDPEIPLILDMRSQMAAQHGLLETDGRIIMPKTLVLDKNLKPLFLLGTEGNDYPDILWKHNP
jgi:peroxiredoxin